MAEDKAKSSPDEAGGNDNKVFSLFCLKSILIWLGDGYILMTLNTKWVPSYCPDTDKVVFFLKIVQKELNYYFQK